MGDAPPTSGWAGAAPPTSAAPATTPAGTAGTRTWQRTWHKEEDVPERCIMLNQIQQLFNARKPNVTAEWKQKLPDFVKRLEEALYRSAPSKEAYADVATLESRLQAVAKRMVARTNSQQQQGQAAAGSSQQQQQQALLQQQVGEGGIPVSGAQVAVSAAQIATTQPMSAVKTEQLQQAAVNGNAVLINPGAMQQNGAMLLNNGQAVMPNGAMVLRGPAAAGYPTGQQATIVQQPNGQYVQLQQGVSVNGNVQQAVVMTPQGARALTPQQQQQLLQQQKQRQQQQAQQLKMQQQAAAAQQQGGAAGQPRTSGAPAASAAPSTSTANMTPEEANKAELQRAYITKQQRWLLFLRHASKCLAPEGQCQYTPYCHVARGLWEHVLQCQDQNCQYPRCVVSKELLRHHQRCQDSRCQVCAPVRQAMHKQRQQAALQQQAQQQALLRQQQAGHAGPSNKRQKVEHGQAAMMAAGGMVAGQVAVGPNGQPLMPGGNKMTSIKGQVGTKKSSGVEGTSLLETFSPEEIKAHLFGLRVPEAKPNSLSARRRDAESAAVLEKAGEEACRGCGIARLTFEPPPLYCNPCGARIKRNQTYYFVVLNTGSGDVKHYWCTSCYSDIKGGFVDVEGHRFPKNALERRKNDEDLEEPWVQCDTCEQWYHQVCALFNGRRNDGGEAAFSCPDCILEGLKRGTRQPTPLDQRPSSQLPASSMPKNKLSNFLEDYIDQKLKADAEARAVAQGKKLSEVPQCEGLTLRIVSCHDKKLEVKSKFLEAFKEHNYPSEFTYKSRVMLLFQKLDGVDVCLFGLYVQEFGADQPAPNNRRVYISYLDSVKYFRPEVQANTGEALRTFVYHQLLTGYLEYVRKLGFTSCYIWACPPNIGEDYILYCHPAKQKTPRPEKLREWYLKLLRMMQKEGTVAHIDNLYDEYGLGSVESMRSAVEVPYFDGDYWPGAAEEMISGIKAEEEERQANLKRSKSKATTARKAGKNPTSKRLQALNGGTQTELDQQLMTKLGEQIHLIKQDFIMAHLYFPCTRCRKTIAGQKRYFATTGSYYSLCEECHGVVQALPEHERDPRPLQCEEIGPLGDTKDEDETLECEFMDTRQAFLSLCQGNHFQFDTLRRAKHTSMMVLFHLHNPAEPAFAASCNICQHDIEPGAGWRCDTCPDFDVCDDCKNRTHHPHPLRPQGARSQRQGGLSEEDRRRRQKQLQRTMALLVHASACQAQNCPSVNCKKVKALFQHGLVCTTKVAGGCQFCRRMWTLLQVHAKACTEPNCPVPRCRDLKMHRRKAEEQVEERRRQAFALYRSKQVQAQQQMGAAA
mmetsp:Transcript_24255/g.82875  ORF Transcript_24255/g.82875 Transcript_24255/m.82875 type:complete len:1312 (+) Transcript_24255:116-4051(+)